MLKLVPVTLKKAQAFIRIHHRHSAPPRGCRFVVGVTDGETLRGVIIMERPKARQLDDGATVEVTRCCTDGARNACSLLYAAAARGARALGYSRVVTYILASEPGVSLRAAGWQHEADVRDERWDRPSRRRNSATPQGRKARWGRAL